MPRPMNAMERAGRDLDVGSPVEIRVGGQLRRGRIAVIGRVLVAVDVVVDSTDRDSELETHWRHEHDVFDVEATDA